MGASLTAEIEALRRHLDQLAGGTDDDLTERYGLKRPPMPPGLYWRLRWLAGWGLRCLRSVWIWRSEAWPVALKAAPFGHNAKPVLIWAIGADRDTLHEACRDFAEVCSPLQGFAPVLVTDVADFAFFSRLGWLVEYVPPLAGEGEPYYERKARFLARLYHRAPALPVRACLESVCRADEIRRWLSP